METQSEVIRAWVIGSDGTEIYVAHSEEEMREFYTKLVGAEEAADDLANHFTEIPQGQMDIEIKAQVENGETGEMNTLATTYRRLAEDGDIPAQIMTGYN